MATTLTVTVNESCGASKLARGSGRYAAYNAAMPRRRNIAVFLPNWIGDVVMATPALHALRAHFADARIAYVGRAGALATLAPAVEADDRVEDRSNRPPRTANALELARRLRRWRPDLAVLLPNSFRTALIARMGGSRRVLGYDRDGRGPLLTDRVRPRRGPGGRFTPMPAVTYYAELVKAIGVRCDETRLTLPVAPADREAADALLAEAGVVPDRPVVLLNPGASFGTSKMWAPERYGALADLLIERRAAQVVLNAAPSERHVARWVEEAMTHRPAISFARRDNSLGLLKALLARCDLLVTNDTGARHVAAALGTPVVTVFGSTDPEWSRIGFGDERIVREPVECSPCQQKLCPLPAGPQYHQCMERIAPERVLAAACELLDLARPKGGGPS